MTDLCKYLERLTWSVCCTGPGTWTEKPLFWNEPRCVSPMCDSDHWWKLQSCCSPVQCSAYQFTDAAFSISLYIVTVSTLLHYCDHSSLGHGSVYTPHCSSLTGWLSSAPARPAQSLPTLARAAGLCPAWPGELDLAPGAATNTDKFRHKSWRLSVMKTALTFGKYQTNMESSLS